MKNRHPPLTPRQQAKTVNTFLDALAWMRSKDAKFRMKDKGSSAHSIAVDALALVVDEAEIHDIEPLELVYAFLLSTWAEHLDDTTRDGFLAAAKTIEYFLPIDTIAP